MPFEPGDRFTMLVEEMSKKMKLRIFQSKYGNKMNIPIHSIKQEYVYRATNAKSSTEGKGL